MASRFILPLADVGNGISPSDGAKLTFFITGTGTLKDTYSDEAKTTPNTNPVIADGDGLFPEIWIDGSYKVTLTDKNDVPQWEEDPIHSTLNSDDIMDVVEATENLAIIFTNLADLVSGTLPDGSSITLTAGQNARILDRVTEVDGGDNTYLIGTFGTANAGSIVDLDSGLQAKGLFPGGIIRPEQFGVLDGLTSSAEFANYQAFVDQGYRAEFGAGTFTLSVDNLDAPIRGAGASTNLLGDGVSAHVLELIRHNPDWDYYKIADITIDGNLRLGHGAVFDTNNQVAGRWLFDNVYFTQCDEAVSKPQGNIGDIYDSCTYRQSEFGHHAVGATLGTMHAGATVWNSSHWDNIDTACIAIDDDTAGTGGYSVNQCIMETCEGFGTFYKLNGATPYIPPVTDQLWLEGVASAGSVTIDSVSYTPRAQYYEGVVFAEIRNSFVRDIELIDSVVVARGCRIDDANAMDIDVDSDSTLFMDDIYANGTIGGEAFVRSIANQVNTSSTKQLSVRGPLMTGQMGLAGYTIATDLASNSYSGTGPWNFSGTATVGATSVSDGVLNETCGELVIPDGYTLQGPQTSTPTTAKWVVWSIHAKLVSGALSTSKIGSGMNLGDVYLKTGKWVRSYGIQKTGTVSTVRLRFENTSGSPATVRLADQTVVQFDDFDDAIEYVNSNTSLKNEI